MNSLILAKLIRTLMTLVVSSQSMRRIPSSQPEVDFYAFCVSCVHLFCSLICLTLAGCMCRGHKRFWSIDWSLF